MTAPSRRRPVVRAHPRRGRAVRRASAGLAGLSRVRAGAALAMLACAGAIYGLAASPAFGLERVDVEGLVHTPEAAVRERLGLPQGANLFGLATDPVVARLRELPTVADVHVSVGLPDRLAVTVVEREPIVAWQIGGHAYLVDRDGHLFAAVATDASAGLPVVDDRRSASASLDVGARLDPVDLDAATRLGSVRAADIGSSAERLRLSVTDENGFVVGTVPDGWTAIFGFYTPSLRTPAMIPGQVRLLRSLLAKEGERNVARIVLASETDGTFATPSP